MKAIGVKILSSGSFMVDSGSSRDSEGAAMDAACGRAMQLQLGGQAALADQLYREVLRAEPSHAMANHCMGLLQVQLQRHEAALPYLAAALNAKPEAADYWLGYLEALLLARRLEEADETLALAMHHGLAGAAVADFARRLAARLPPQAATNPAPAPAPASTPRPAPAGRPRSSTSRKMARTAGKRGGAARRPEARLHPQEAVLQILIQQERHVEALTLAQTMTKKFPMRGLAWKILGGLLWWQGRHEEALAPMQVSARLMPRDAEAHNNVGMALLRLLRYDEAISCFHRSLALDPKFAAAHYHLGMAHSMQEHYAEAEASLCKAIALRPDYITAEAGPVQSDLLFILSHSANYDGEALFAEHRRFGVLLESQLPATWPAHANTKDAERCLKIGFVSGDLNNHAVATFIEPVLAQLSVHPGLELHAYYNKLMEDGVTRRLRAYFKRWHSITVLSDADLAKKIMDDGIDILIDLSGHTALNRLRALARKPAPIQVSWIGYPGTTGLRAFDYYFAERHWLPPGQFETRFIEKLVYLPATAPFEPSASAPAVNGLPALETGAVTFGSFNRLGKISAATIRMWSQLLAALPNAKLLLGGMPADGALGHVMHRFAAAGITGERLTLHRRGSMDAYLALHHQVDICLDTFPYSGGTTTYHALWMGVPTLTIDGSTPAGRQSAAILGQAGLDEFVAANPADFVRRGVHWAGHLDALAEVRKEIRGRWQRLPTQRPEATGAAVERALRHMWRRWCAGLPPESFEPLPMDPPFR
jgi:predicted O-linked N-acetylglucosamine transferase (SPINDLY family)